MQIKAARFVTSADSVASCPESEVPEFAFIGRSNVGKSSLLNMLCRKGEISRVSKTPGRTQLINFFVVNDHWSLVDLPGYGFVKSSKQARDAFEELIAGYFLERDSLTCAFVLIDSRHTPQKIDLEFTAWLVENNVPFVIVFTKADKVKATQLKKHTALFLEAMEEFCDELPRTFVTSSKKSAGRTDVLNFIEQCLG